MATLVYNPFDTLARHIDTFVKLGQRIAIDGITTLSSKERATWSELPEGMRAMLPTRLDPGISPLEDAETRNEIHAIARFLRGVCHDGQLHAKLAGVPSTRKTVRPRRGAR